MLPFGALRFAVFLVAFFVAFLEAFFEAAFLAGAFLEELEAFLEAAFLAGAFLEAFFDAFFVAMVILLFGERSPPIRAKQCTEVDLVI